MSTEEDSTVAVREFLDTFQTVTGKPASEFKGDPRGLADQLEAHPTLAPLYKAAIDEAVNNAQDPESIKGLDDIL